MEEEEKIRHKRTACTDWSNTVQEVDPCEDLTNDDIRIAIQNTAGPKSTLFVQ